MSYKTIRYPGHCEKMRLLMYDLQLNQDRETLKRILENAVARTYQDVVIVFVVVKGLKRGELIEKFYMKKVYPKTIANHSWSAIQMTTASGICSVVDIVLTNRSQYQGFVYQESILLESIINNQFGKCFN